MKRLLVLVAVLVSAPMAVAKVWTTVYRCDEVTLLGAVDPNQPTVYGGIMAGTRLVILVSSDTGGDWWGHLRLSWQDAPYAALSGRGYNPRLLKYEDSCLESAGRLARAWSYNGSRGVGLEFYTDGQAVPGDWFVFDYRAEQVGFCDVNLYNLFVSLGVPIETLSFTHVPSRDFNGDTVVNLGDLAMLAGHWRSAVDLDPNSPQVAFDLNSDGHIDVGDLALFSEYWLERTDCEKSVADPNNSSPSL